MLDQKLAKLTHLSDVVLTTPDGARFEVQKAVLAAQSDFFPMNAFKDLADSKEFPISEASERLKLALAYMYDTAAGSQTFSVTLDNVRSLLDFFGKYDVPKGIRACDSFLSASVVLTPSSLPEWIILADRHRLLRFLSICESYTATRMTLVAGSGAEEWLAKLAPATLVRLVMKVCFALPLQLATLNSK